MSLENYLDDSSVADESSLWRRIPPIHFVDDENTGKKRPSSAAFDNDKDGDPMSVVIAAESRGKESVLKGHEGFALAAITAGLARSCGQILVRKPLAEEPAHALVVGDKPKKVRKKLAGGFVWVVPPPA